MQDFQQKKEFINILFLIRSSAPSLNNLRGWHIKKKLDTRINENWW